MFEFFGSILFWLFIGLMLIFQLINGLGFHGYGAKRHQLMAFGMLGDVILAILTWITEGFLAFIAFILLYFLFMFFTTPIVFSLIRSLGNEPRNQNPGENDYCSQNDFIEDIQKEMDKMVQERLRNAEQEES